jgi:hypothetical protein
LHAACVKKLSAARFCAMYQEGTVAWTILDIIIIVIIIVFFQKYFLDQWIYFSFLNTQTMHFESIKHNSIAMLSLKTLFPGRIRTRVFCSRGRFDVDCATPPGYYLFFTVPRQLVKRTLVKCTNVILPKVVLPKGVLPTNIVPFFTFNTTPYTLAGFYLTTDGSNLLRGRRRWYHFVDYGVPATWTILCKQVLNNALSTLGANTTTSKFTTTAPALL